MPESRTIHRAACAVVLLSTIGCASPAIDSNHPVYREHAVYQGDGEFRDITAFIGPHLVTGYEIRMPEFSLGEPLMAEYRLSSLRDIDKRCDVYLAIPGEIANQLRSVRLHTVERGMAVGALLALPA